MNKTQHRRLFLEEMIWQYQAEIGEITRNCQHTNIKKGRLMWSPRYQKVYQTHDDYPLKKKDDDCVSVFCQDCGKEFGWYCPVNPKGYCEYDLSGSYFNENCVFCHIPSERK